MSGELQETVGLPLVLALAGARVLLVGENEESPRKRQLLERAGARIEECTPESFAAARTVGMRLVFVSSSDGEITRHVVAAARQAGALVWSLVGERDFTLPAVACLGEAQIAIATGGASPMLARRLRTAFEEQLGDRFARFVAALGELRRGGRTLPTFAERHGRLTAALHDFAIELHVRYPDWLK